MLKSQSKVMERVRQCASTDLSHLQPSHEAVVLMLEQAKHKVNQPGKELNEYLTLFTLQADCEALRISLEVIADHLKEVVRITSKYQS